MSTLLHSADYLQRVAPLPDSGANARWAGGYNVTAAPEEANALLLQAYTLSIANCCA